MRKFVNLIFQHSLVPIVNKPIKVTKNNVTLIDYIITNSFTDQENFTGILETHISDHYPVFIIFLKHRLENAKNSRIQRCVKWIGGTCIQYLIPTMPMNTS